MFNLEGKIKKCRKEKEKNPKGEKKRDKNFVLVED